MSSFLRLRLANVSLIVILYEADYYHCHYYYWCYRYYHQYIVNININSNKVVTESLMCYTYSRNLVFLLIFS